MRYDDLRWRGQLASSLGVVVTKQVDYIRPEEQVNTVTIQGHAGTLVPLGQRAFTEVVYAPGCAIMPGADRERIRAWLAGSGAVVFGSMEDFAFEARLANQIEMIPAREGDPDGWIEFTPVFTCQPFRFPAAIPPMARILPGDANPATLTNRGNIRAQPIIHIRGLTGGITCTLSGVSFHLADTPPDVTVDCEMMDAYKSNKSQLLNSKMTGGFPVLEPGDNFFSWKLDAAGSGFSMIEINLNERWL